VRQIVQQLHELRLHSVCLKYAYAINTLTNEIINTIGTLLSTNKKLFYTVAVDTNRYKPWNFALQYR
jgi:hypothetical protein